MRLYVLLFVCAYVVSTGSFAWALDASAHVECLNGAHELTVAGYYDEETDGEIVGIVFERKAIGLCVTSDFVPENPLPFLPQFDPGSGLLEYEAALTIVPPLDGVAYRYKPFGVRADGSLVSTLHHCGADLRSYALAACEGVPFARGTVEIVFGSTGRDLVFNIALCESDCWTEPVNVYLDIDILEGLSGEPMANLLGQVVDVFGERTYCSMPGGDYYIISRIELAPESACGPVPNENMTWGGLKSLYR